LRERGGGERGHTTRENMNQMVEREKRRERG